MWEVRPFHLTLVLQGIYLSSVGFYQLFWKDISITNISHFSGYSFLRHSEKSLADMGCKPMPQQYLVPVTLIRNKPTDKVIDGQLTNQPICPQKLFEQSHPLNMTFSPKSQSNQDPWLASFLCLASL